MRDNPLRKKFDRGSKALGCWLVANNPMSAEVLAATGYDFVLIDHEHGPGDLIGAINQMNAIAAAGEGKAEGGPARVLRVPWNDPVYIKRALDLGVEGVMIPMIQTRAEAEAAVEACLYPPAGIRGSALGAVRATGYGTDSADYWKRVNRELLIVAQIETEKAVENIAEIAAVERIDVLFIGPGDLTTNAGFDPVDPPQEALELIDRTAASVKELGKWLGIVPFGGRTPAELFGMGYDMVAAHTELTLLRRAAAADIDAVRKYTK